MSDLFEAGYQAGFRAASAAREDTERPDDEGAQQLYLALAIFDTRDGSLRAELVRAAREGYERSGPEMGESDIAWEEFEALRARYNESTRGPDEVWLCPKCGECQRKVGVMAHCAGSVTQGTEHKHTRMVASPAQLPGVDPLSVCCPYCHMREGRPCRVDHSGWDAEKPHAERIKLANDRRDEDPGQEHER
jgi:hypothetical protein